MLTPQAEAITLALTRARASQESADRTVAVLAVAGRSAGLTYPQIGAAIGLTESGARGLVKRGRAAG